MKNFKFYDGFDQTRESLILSNELEQFALDLFEECETREEMDMMLSIIISNVTSAYMEELCCKRNFS